MQSRVHKILIHEYITGGEWPEPELPSGLASEGLSMLSAVVDDFSKWEKVIVYTTLDKRLSNISLTADNITIIDPAEYKDSIAELAKECDFAFIIASESQDILAGLNKLMNDNETTFIGCGLEAICITGDKWECHKRLFSEGLPVPKTICTDRYKVLESAIKFGFPLVIKPADGVGCEGVHLVNDIETLKVVLKTDPAGSDKLLLQEYIRGEHLSVSMLSTGKEFVLLSLNRQHIKEGFPFIYLGGEVMPPPVKGEDLHNIIEDVMKVILGLKGYVGIDLVRSEEGYKIIEINPRLTTSYVGIREVINIHLAKAMFEAVVEGKLPHSIKIAHNYSFNKELAGNFL